MAAGDLISDVWQVEWRGTLWGHPATTVGVSGLVGWLDLPGLRGNNADRPSRHGSLPGQKRATERVVEVELTVIGDDPTALAGIRSVTGLDEDPIEEPLVIWAGTDAPQMVTARLERRAVPTDQDWSVGYHRATLQWVASDPKRYGVTANSPAGVGLPTAPVGGLAFPLSFPLAFGSGAGAGGLLSLPNAGNAAVWPTLTVTGPVTGPVITNTTTGQRLQFDPTFVVAAGQTMTIDTDLRAVTVAGVSRRDRLILAEWFPLPASSTTTVTFSSTGTYDPAASLSATWRDGYL